MEAREPNNDEVVINEQNDQEQQKNVKIETPNPQPNQTGVGVFFCMVTLIGTRMGGGIVGIPYATQQIGFLATLFLQFGTIIVGIFAIWLLLKVREITGESSLSNIGYFCYGRISIFFINTMIAIGQLGFPIIFFIVFGDVAGGLIEKVNTSGIFFWSSRWFTHTILAIAMFYLVLKKEIHQLKYAGFALLILISIFIILFFIHFMTSNPNPTPKADLVNTKMGIKFFAFLPTLFSSFSIHPSFFTAFLALKDKTTKNGLKSAILSLLALLFVYISTPLISFGIYGGNIKSNMLKNVAKDNGVIPVILLFIYMMIAVIHIPIIYFIGKEGVLIFFDEATRRSYSKNRVVNIASIESAQPVVLQESDQCICDQPAPIESNSEPEEEKSNNQNVIENNEEMRKTDKIESMDSSVSIVKTPSTPKAPNPKEYLTMKPLYYYTLTILSFVTVVILSIIVGDVSLFFGIIGSLVACFMILAGPGSYYIISTHKMNIKFNGVTSVIVYIIAWIYAIVGLSGMIGLSTTVILAYIAG